MKSILIIITFLSTFASGFVPLSLSPHARFMNVVAANKNAMPVVNQKTIVDRLAIQHSLPNVQMKNIVSEVFGMIKSSLIEDHKVSIANFGIFEKKGVASRAARNPKTGEEITVPATNKVKFSVSSVLKKEVKESPLSNA